VGAGPLTAHRDGAVQPKRPGLERQFDVIVCGAGVAGIAAALETARAGLRTALVEKTVTPGGLATSGLVWYYPPLCDAAGRHVTRGAAEELLRLSFRYGPGRRPDEPQDVGDAAAAVKSGAIFSPAAFVLALDEALVGARVGMWFDTLACEPILDGDRVVGVEVETKAGRGVFLAHCIIDATGDADISYRAGAVCEPGGNLLAIWALQASLEAARKAVERNSGLPLQDLVLFGSNVANAGGGAEKSWSGLDAESVTAFVLAGRAFLRDHYAKLYATAGASGRQDAFPVTLPSIAQFRTTRRIVGRANLTGSEHDQHQPDSIGLVADWLSPSNIWEVPYGTLVPTGIRGVLAAGRCIASSGHAWEVTRVFPGATLTGQAAGLAAVLAVRAGTTPDTVDVGALQEELAGKSIPYHLDHVRGPG